MVRTTLAGTNPDVVVECLRETDQEPLARIPAQYWLTGKNGRYLVYDTTGQVVWERADRSRRWDVPPGITFLHGEAEFQHAMQKAPKEVVARFRNMHEQGNLDATRQPRPTPLIKSSFVGPYLPVFSVVGVRGNNLLAALDSPKDPRRSFLVYDPAWESPRCWQLPEDLADAQGLTHANSAVNDSGLWLAEPFGYFPWELFLNEAWAKQSRQKQGPQPSAAGQGPFFPRVGNRRMG